MMDFDCVGFGICALDYLCVVPHYPRLDEKTEAVDFSLQGGGPVATALVALARLGARTAFMGRIGDDASGKILLNEFNAENINTLGTIVDKTMPTNQAFIWIDRSTGKKSIVLNARHYQPVLPNELKLGFIRSARYLLLDGRDTAASFELINWIHRRGGQVVLDAGSPRDRTDELLSRVDYPVVSESFCQSYLGLTDYEAAVTQLLDFGASAAVVTCGSQGCYGGDATGIYYQPAYAVEVVDTTGAGDVFHGAFIFGLLNNWHLKEVLKFASAAAALKCTGIGGRSAIADFEGVNNFLNHVRLQVEENHR